MKRHRIITPVRFILLTAALFIVGLLLWTNLRRGSHTQRWLESCKPFTPTKLPLTPSESSPRSELEKSNDALQSVLRKSSTSDRTDTEEILQSLFDVEEFVRRALALQFTGINPEQRDEFVEMFRMVLVRMLSKDIHNHPNYRLQFTGETFAGGEASVEATLDLSSDGSRAPATLDYKLHYKSGRWLVYDVIVDKQSMIKNYEAEFEKIIASESFDGVFRRTKKRFEKSE